MNHFGFDACVDYKADDWREQGGPRHPDGVDVDFEDVGGEIMDQGLGRLNVGARVLLSGMISQYNDYGHQELPGQRQIAQILMQRATMRGFPRGEAGGSLNLARAWSAPHWSA